MQPIILPPNDSTNRSMPAPDAQLLLSTHCPHCPAVLAALADLVKQGVIGRLEVVNLEQHPEVGQALGVRSVPWLRIGRIELSGVHSKAELAEWAAKADSEAGLADWFHLLLKEGQLPRAQAAVEADPALLAAVLPIVGNVDASLNVRLGAGVLLETFAGTAALRALLPRLGELSRHADARVRADACHYLGLTADATARPWLHTRLEDDDADVREIAAESLEALGTEAPRT
jgi:glutaredoxin